MSNYYLIDKEAVENLDKTWKQSVLSTSNSDSDIGREMNEAVIQVYHRAIVGVLSLLRPLPSRQDIVCDLIDIADRLMIDNIKNSRKKGLGLNTKMRSRKK